MTEPSAKLVMIVEDNDLNMKLFRDLLHAHGYRTIHTRDGMDVLPLARQHKPNLIIMDIQLPEMDEARPGLPDLREESELRDSVFRLGLAALYEE